MQEIKILDLKHTGIKTINKLETFILIKGTKHYYISSEGRLSNDIKGSFYTHKNTLETKTNRVHWKILYEEKNSRELKDVRADSLVAQAFLKPVKGKNRVYHIDGNTSNSRYDNLIFVSDSELRDLGNGSISIKDLNRDQEYIPFFNSNRMKAERLWNDMNSRCYNEKLHKRHPGYKGCSVCEYWLNDKERFYKWVEDNYYTAGSEQMDLDKDILFKGNKVYSPETCIFVPHTINTLLINCKRKRGKYPLGVYYEKKKGKYRAEMNMDGRAVKLGYFHTAEEAFMEYKRHKEALILVTSDRYKKRIPDKLYNAMINWKIEIGD